jgi:large conductance mechanosensitive channel
MIKGFKEFILRGNVVDLAVGVIVGASFNGVVSSLVANVITPFIGAIIKSPDFSNLSFTINSSVFLYGNFLNAIISFLIVAITVYFFIVVPINKLTNRTKKSKKTVEPETKKCPECLSVISLKAKRCAFCTSILINEKE